MSQSQSQSQPQIPRPMARSGIQRLLDIAHRGTVSILVGITILSSFGIAKGYYDMRNRRITWEQANPDKVKEILAQREQDKVNKVEDKNKFADELREKLGLKEPEFTKPINQPK